MSVEVNSLTPGARKLLDDLADKELLTKVTWEQWLDVGAPFPDVAYRTRDVTARYARNGYDWDIHGTLYEPERESRPGIGFVLFHGGAGSEKEMHETPDGRPSLAAILAAQGFRCLSITYTGHYPPGGEWKESVAERQPYYLLDRKLSLEEIADRNMRCTFNVHMQGAGLLTDEHMRGYRLLCYGHSTGGPMSMDLYRVIKHASVVGIVGFGSGGPDGWQTEWDLLTGGRPHKVWPMDSLARRSPEYFRKSGYEEDASLAPWGGAEGYAKWADRFKSQFKTGLCSNQHAAMIPVLEKYAALTGLSRDEYLDYLRDPDPAWLAGTGVFLLVAERDRRHWITIDDEKRKLEVYLGGKFALRTPWTRVTMIPRLAHYGFAALHNEKIVYAWLWALVAGLFPKAADPKQPSVLSKKAAAASHV